MKTNKQLGLIVTLMITSIIPQFLKAQQQSRPATIHKAYYGKWHQTVTFEQQTNFYKNDSLKSTQKWKEYAKFPSLFRIELFIIAPLFS